MKRPLQQMEKIGVVTNSMKALGSIKKLSLRKIRLNPMQITSLNRPRSERSKLVERCNRANRMRAVPAIKSFRRGRPLLAMGTTTLLPALVENLSVTVRVKRRTSLSLMMLVSAISHVRNGLAAGEEGEEDLAAVIMAETVGDEAVGEEGVAAMKESIAEGADEEGVAGPAIRQMSWTRTPFPVLGRDDKTFQPLAPLFGKVDSGYIMSN